MGKKKRKTEQDLISQSKQKTVKDKAFYSRIGKLRSVDMTEERRKEIASQGGTTSRGNMTAAQRSAAAKYAAECRWGKKKKS